MSEKNKNPFSTGAGLGIFGEVSGTDEQSLIGRVLDGYRITGFIAEGGMGRVYRAERADGSFERDVAIKLSAISGFSSTMRERFMLEQGVLAGLNHPHIAQLYDARVTDEGWPYIVMEFVDGESVTEYCDEHSLGLDERIRLLHDVIDAVSFAHANLVVHRDIKPTNVLVTSDGKPKLLDFGIAKLLEDESGGLTHAGAMTPRYASPEQLLGKAVTTASDIYQLGMLLAEVLTGESVNDSETLADAIQRAASETHLPLSSQAKRKLPREVVLIIEQCLRPSPAERYQDANSLKSDLRAYLSGYPVSAAGLSTGYRLRKFIQRNSGAAGVAALAFIGIFGSSIWYAVSLDEARRIAETERDEAGRQAAIAQESLDFLTTVLTSANPDVAQRGSLTVREVLDEGVERIATELADQPAIQSRLYRELSQTYQNLGDFETQQELIDLAEAPTLAAFGSQSEEYFRLRLGRGTQYYAAGDYAGGRMYYEELLEDITAALGADHVVAFQCRAALSNNLWGLGDMQGFADISTENLRYADDALGSEDPITLNAAHNVAISQVDQGQYDKAIELASKYASIADQTAGAGHTVTLSLFSILASAHGYKGNLDEELDLRKTIIDRQVLARGDEHPAVGSAKVNLAYVYNDLEQFDEVERLFSEAVDIWSSSLGEDNPVTLRGRRNLAVFQARHGLNPDAAADLDGIISLQSASLGPDHPNTVESRLHRAELLLRAGSVDADANIETMSTVGDQVLGANSPIMQRFRQAIAEIRAEHDSTSVASPD